VYDLALKLYNSSGPLKDCNGDREDYDQYTKQKMSSTFTNKDGFLAFVDVIGTSDSDNDAQEKIARILSEMHEVLIPSLAKLDPHGYRDYVDLEKWWLISDTLILAFPRKEGTLYSMSVHYYINDILGLLIASALLEGVLLRGAVGYGKMKIWDYGVWGNSSTDAKLEFEQTEWAGVHYAPKASLVINGWVKEAESKGWKNTTRFYDDEPEVVLHHRLAEVPFKEEYKKRWSDQDVTWERFTVPWPWYIQRVIHVREKNTLSEETAHDRIAKILHPLQSHKKKSVCTKALNTISYFNAYISKHPSVNLSIDVKGPFPVDSAKSTSGQHPPE